MKNPFIIFQISPIFDIDLAELTTKYRALVSDHHPDKGGNALTMEDINTSYNILRNPIKRARALVENKGVIIADDETVTDPIILEEIFELRISGNKTNIQTKQYEALQVFKNAIESNDVAAIKQAYWLLLYLQKIKIDR